MSDPLPPPKRNQLISIMVKSGEFDSQEKRRNFFFVTGYQESIPKVTGALKLDSPTYEFCATLVRLLSEYGVLPNSHLHTLHPLLDYLREQMAGQSSERWVIEELIEVVNTKAPPPPSTSTDINQIYNQALNHFTNQEWEVALPLLELLESRQDNRKRVISVSEMKQRTINEVEKLRRRREMREEYGHIAMLAKKPEWRERVKKAWNTLLYDYPEFQLIADDTESIGTLFYTSEQRRLLELMLNMKNSPAERAKAGMELAAIGDPRPGVGLREDGIPDIVWCYVPDEGATPIGGDHNAFRSLPAQNVKLPPFWLAKYPITHQQFQAFLDDPKGYYGKSSPWWDGLAWAKPEHRNAQFPNANHPPHTLNWYECVAFCRWLTHSLKAIAPRQLAATTLTHEEHAQWEGLAKGTLVVRLPTEQEWEKAARGKQGWYFSYQSNEYDPQRMNVGQTGMGQTSAVGIFTDSPSPYGVMDMSGNVWEWVLTTFENNDNRVEGEAARVLRGGSWPYVDQFSARAASRGAYHPDVRNGSIGGRAALAAPI